MRLSVISRSKRTISAAIFVVALLVRVVPMGLYVTPDEPIWVLRSLGLYDAVRAGAWGEIPQTGHPGMTTMILGGLAIGIQMLVEPEQATYHADWLRNLAWLAPENSAAFPHLYYFLPLARWLVAIVTSMCVAGLYWLVSHRLGKRTAALAGLIIALDPFFAGLSGLLHTDALQASFAMLALAAVLPGRDTRWSHSWVDILFAALCLALSGMSKTLGWLIAPGAAFILLSTYRGTWLRRIAATACLTLATLAFAFLLYPPVWVQPGPAFAALTAAIGYHEGIGLRDVFFIGQMYDNPGPLFYPAVILFRLTPPVLLGLFVAWRHQSAANKTAHWLLLPALIYLAGITWATKKFDRYAASLFPVFAVVAAAHLQGATSKLLRHRQILAACLLLPWAITAILPLYYADPLLGGPWLAQHVIPLGWGESAGLAVKKLKTLTPGDGAILTANVPGTASLYNGEVYAWNNDLLPCVSAYIDGEEHTSATFPVRFIGMPLVFITPTDVIPAPLPEAGVDETVCEFVMPSEQDLDSIATFDGNLGLLAYHISSATQAPDALVVKSRWLPRKSPDVSDIYLVLHGVDDDLIWDEGGMRLISTTGWPASAWQPGEVMGAEAYIPLDLTMPPGTYRLGLRLMGSDGNWLGISSASGGFAGVELDLGTVKVLTPRYSGKHDVMLPVTLDIPFVGGWVVGSSIIPDQQSAGGTLAFQLELRRNAKDSTKALAWAITCDDGTDIGGEVFEGQSFFDWPAQYVYVLRYAVPLPVDMPDASCQLAVYQGQKSLLDLGAFEVKARSRAFEFEIPPQTVLDVQVGEFARLVGIDVPESLSPGLLGVNLYWSAQGRTSTSYTVFIQLLGPDGQVVAQVDALPAHGSAPTSTWIENQVVYDPYTLEIPEKLAAGTYKLIAGLYDAGNGTRVPLFDHNGRLEGDYVQLMVYTPGE